MQFLSLPSALNGVRVGLPLQGSGLCRLFGLSLGRSVRWCPTLVFASALACLLSLAPLGHTPVCWVFPVMGGAGRSEVTLMGHCHRPWVI